MGEKIISNKKKKKKRKGFKIPLFGKMICLKIYNVLELEVSALIICELFVKLFRC